MIKKFLSILLAVLLILTMASCQKSPNPLPKDEGNKKDEQQQDSDDIDVSKLLPLAVFTMEDGQVFEVELYKDVAPVTVDNFIKLIRSGFYDGTLIHRITNAVIQGGGIFLDQENNEYQKHANNIVGEFLANGHKNNLSHTQGVISMARASNYNSATSQFFICYEDCPYYDGDYAAFGRVRTGFNVIKDIASAPIVGASGDGPPIYHIIIKKVTLKYVEQK